MCQRLAKELQSAAIDHSRWWGVYSAVGRAGGNPSVKAASRSWQCWVCCSNCHVSVDGPGWQHTEQAGDGDADTIGGRRIY